MGLDILQGLSDAALAIVTRDDAEGYSCGEAVILPGAARLRQQWIEPERALYSDDGVRMRARARDEMEAELRLAGVDPVKLVELGLWASDADSRVIHDGLPRGGRGYSLRFVTDTLDSGVYCVKYRMFWAMDIRPDDIVSRGCDTGQSGGATGWSLSGVLRAPRCGRVAWRESLKLDDRQRDNARRLSFIRGAE